MWLLLSLTILMAQTLALAINASYAQKNFVYSLSLSLSAFEFLMGSTEDVFGVDGFDLSGDLVGFGEMEEERGGVGPVIYGNSFCFCYVQFYHYTQ